VQIELVDDRGFDMWATFRGPFRAPERDYGRDEPNGNGAPAFQRPEVDGPKWEYRTWEMEAYWRAWLQAVREVYAENEAHLPSVIGKLPPVEIPQPAPRDVDPNEIPF